ncbi:hypothetical protein GGI35DRAFT_477957 [Trichoderma velutinum]
MTLVMNWSSLIPSMVVVNALHEASSPLYSHMDRCYGTPRNWNTFGCLNLYQQPLLWDSATRNYLEDPKAMKDLGMHTSHDPLKNESYSLDRTETSDLSSASSLVMNEPMVSLVNGYSVSEAASPKEMDKNSLEDDAVPGPQNNNIAKVFDFYSSVDSTQIDDLTLPFFEFPLVWQNTDWMEDILRELEERNSKDKLHEFLSLYLSVVSTIGGVIGYVAGIADMPDVADAAANLGFIVAVGKAGLEIRSTLEDPRNSRLGHLTRFFWKIWSMIRDNENVTQGEESDQLSWETVLIGNNMIERVRNGG